MSADNPTKADRALWEWASGTLSEEQGDRIHMRDLRQIWTAAAQWACPHRVSDIDDAHTCQRCGKANVIGSEP